MLDEFQDKWMTWEDEQELVASARQGDMVALDELILLYLPAFQRMTLSFYSNPLDAEDLLQETLKKVMNQISGFEGKSRFTTWVYKVMRCTFCDELRRQKKLPPRQSLDAGESSEATLSPTQVRHQAPEIPNGDPDSAAIIRELIDKLPPRQRKVVHHYYLDEVPLLKVADLLGIPYTRVRKDASDAMKTLKRMCVDFFPSIAPVATVINGALAPEQHCHGMLKASMIGTTAANSTPPQTDECLLLHKAPIDPGAQ